jgi:hypothetical protein
MDTASIATPFHAACASGNVALAAEILGSAADGGELLHFHTHDKDADTALHIACRMGKDHVVRFLLERSEGGKLLDVNATNGGGVTPLTLASMFGRLECVKVLLLGRPVEVNVNIMDKFQMTALTHSLARCEPEISKCLIATGRITDTRLDRILLFMETDKEFRRIEGWEESVELIRRFHADRNILVRELRRELSLPPLKK